MASHRVYFRKEQEKEIQEEADRLGIEVSELIKIRLETARTMNERLTRLEASYSRLEVSYNVLFQMLSIAVSDTSWLRGLLEVQSQHNDTANKRASDLEIQRRAIATELYEKGEELSRESQELGTGTHL